MNQKITIKFLLYRYKWFLLAIILLSLGSNALNLVVPKLIGDAIDTVPKSSPENINIGITNLKFDSVIWIFGAAIGGFVLSLLELGISVWLSEKFARNMRRNTFLNLSRQPYQYVIKEGSAKIITVFNSDIDNIQDNFTNSLSYLFQSVFLLLGSVALMYTTSWKLATVALLSLPFIVIIFGFIFSKIGKLFKQSQENLTNLNDKVSENINGSMLIRVLSSFQSEKTKYTTTTEDGRRISLGIVRGFSSLFPLITVITSLVTAIFLYFGGQLVVSSELTIGEITAFLSYYSLLITPIFILGFTSQGITQALVSWKRIEPILNAKFEVKDGDHVQKTIRGDISVQNLSLDYEGKTILDNLNFEIKAGQRTAIIGPTGGGKSQLLNLLVGLNQPSQGSISVDGVNLTDWNKGELLSKIGIVFQENLIFNTSFAQNIVLDRSISQEKLNLAIQTAQLQDFVDAQDIDKSIAVTEKGANLSGGQKQRLTLARAIVSEPDLLLLDDFTARVDNQTEAKVYQALSKNYPKTQIIQVSQKIDSIKDYENIIVIMEGQILGQGTHSELMQNCPEYKLIYKNQQVLEV